MSGNAKKRSMDAEVLGLTSGLIALSMSLGKHMREHPHSIPQFCHCLHTKRSRIRKNRSKFSQQSSQAQLKKLPRQYVNPKRTLSQSARPWHALDSSNILRTTSSVSKPATATMTKFLVMA